MRKKGVLNIQSLSVQPAVFIELQEGGKVMSVLARMKGTAKKVGLPPGTLVHVGERKAEKVRMRVFEYNADTCHERELENSEECHPFRGTTSVTWLNIDGLHEPEIIEKIGYHFNLHPLVQEDILHTNQRPKMEDHEEYILIVVRMLYYDQETDAVKSEQVSIILGAHCVISFQELEGDVFDPLRERIRQGKGKIRKLGADYLAYALIDMVVDHYFVLLEKLGERIAVLEDELTFNPRQHTIQAIHSLKQEIVFLRKSLWPMREVINSLSRSESPLISHELSLYTRDLYDHTIQVIDAVETYQDLLSGMLELYLSSMSNKMNEVMKVLTIFASIFIPLTFLAGIYGMNFEFMPELKWRWSYPVLLCCMCAAGVGMLAFFKRKKWL